MGEGLGRDSEKEIEHEKERQNRERKKAEGVKDEKEGDRKADTGRYVT